MRGVPAPRRSARSSSSPSARPGGAASRSSRRSVGVAERSSSSPSTVSPCCTRSSSSRSVASSGAERTGESATSASNANGAATAAGSGRPSASAATTPTAVTHSAARSRGVAKRVSVSDVESDTALVEILGRRRRHLLQQLGHHLVASDLLQPQLGRERQPVRQRGHRDRLHVLRRHIRAALQHRLPARELEQREPAARAGADLDTRVVARRAHKPRDVVDDRLRDVHQLERALHLHQRRRVDHRRDLDLVRRPLDPLLEQLALVLERRVADPRAQDEPVELRLRQRIGALVLDRVLRRDHHERRRQPPGRPPARHLPLLHRLQAAPPASSAERGSPRRQAAGS